MRNRVIKTVFVTFILAAFAALFFFLMRNHDPAKMSVCSVRTDSAKLITRSEPRAATVSAAANDTTARVKPQVRDTATLGWYIVSSEPGVAPDRNRWQFEAVDLRSEAIIPTHARQVRLSTRHPAGSFVLHEDDEGNTNLCILEPDRFWKHSRYLIIEVK